MWQIIKTSLKTTVKNWTTLILFEILYKVICYSVIYTVMSDILGYALKLSGITYMSFENITQVLTCLPAALLLLCIALIVIVCAYFEIAFLYLYCEKGWNNERTSLRHLLKEAFCRCAQLFRPGTLLFFIGFLITTLLAVVPFSRYIFGWSGIPEFIMEFITQNKLLRTVFITAVIVLTVLFFLYLFALPSVILYKKKVKESWKTGLAALKKQKIKTALRFFLSFLFFFISVACIAGLCAAGVWAYSKLFYSAGESAGVFQFMLKNWGRTVLVLINAAGTIWLFAVTVTLFHTYRGEARPKRVKEKVTVSGVLKCAVVMLCSVVALMIYSETEIGGNIIYNRNAAVKIVAHRAGSTFAPENTIAALNQAVDDHADMAEIDVQQLRDGTLVIMHDSNFKRTAGQDKDVWEADYSEVKKYDAGSFYSQEYAGEPIPTLDWMLDKAKNRIHLMIELKLTGHEENEELIGGTLKRIQQYGMEHQCCIASMNLSVLKRTKELSPDIETVYITPLLYSQRYDIGYIDGYSVETTSLSREMVTLAQLQGKKVYGWTANSEVTIKKNLRCQTDGIITDNPELVRYYMEEKDTNDEQ